MVSVTARAGAEGVERALQDVGGRQGVDGAGALAPGQIGLQHGPGHRHGGQALVPECDRQIALGQQIAGKLPHRLAARALAAVHVQRQADDQAAHIALGHDLP